MNSVNASDYRVGIICALPKEKAAVRAMLDKEYEAFQGQDTQDCNSYSLGRIHEHNVAVACLPAGVYGTATAATVARDMLRTFPEIRVGLMVGIGGGIPNFQQNNIRLGDIVVSQPDRTHGGVIQYDLGKQTDGEFTRKGSLDKPPGALLTALSSLQAQHELSDSKVSTYMDSAYQKHSKLLDLGYSFPGSEKDVLHCPTCGSDRWWWKLWLLLVWLCTLWQCQVCVNSLVHRQKRKSKDPKIHYGIIASGNSLIKDARIRDRLGRELGAKCVEMEAAGLMDHFRCIIIRGICDYADVYNNDEWQEYAALAAAGLAKELLEFLAPTKVTHEKPLKDVCDILETQNRILQEQVDITTQHFQEVKQQKKRAETRDLNESQRRCLQGFKTSAYSEYKESIKKAVPGTCQWVLKNDAFHRWRSSSTHDLLWISADPGCGKSVLAKFLVDEKLPNEGLIVCYFFFKDNGAQDNLSAALCALLHQLFDQNPQLICHAIPAWEKNSADKLVNEVEELWTIFLSAANDPRSPNIICVLDALDECRDYDRDRLVGYLTRFHTAKSMDQQHWLKFLVTSRPYDTIRDQLELSPDLPTIRVRGEDENDLIRKDIDLVIEDHVLGLARRARLSCKTRDRLRDQLLQMEHRTYLWLYLSIQGIEDAIRDNPRPDSEEVLTGLIDHLPPTVEEAYEKILRKIEGSENANHVKSILKIVIGAKRPLTVGEMAIACGIATYQGELITLEDSTLNVDKIPDWIRRLTNLFTFINHGKVYLIHQTAKEFLVRKQSDLGEITSWKHSLSLPEIEAEMSYVCVHFLLLTDVGAVGEQLERKLKKMGYLQSYDAKNEMERFIIYSATNWTSHYRCTSFTTDRPSLKTVLGLYDIRESGPGWWHRLKLGTTRAEGNTAALFIAASFGHTRVVESLLQSGAQDNISDDCNEVLFVASRFGHEEIVELALDQGADVRASGGHCGGALQAAANFGHYAIAKLLLDRGADFNASGDYGTALRMAASHGHRNIVELLLDRGAEVNTTDSRHGNALLGACSKGSRDIVQLLLDRGADVNVNGQDPDYGRCLHDPFSDPLLSPLQQAAYRGHLKVIRLLLDRGAEVNASGYHGTALQVALSSQYKNRQETVVLLIDHGADVNADDISEYRPRWEAIYKARQNAIEASSEDWDWSELRDMCTSWDDDIMGNSSAIALASREGHQDVVKLLLDKGAVETLNDEAIYNKVLLEATSNDYWEIVELLLGTAAGDQIDFGAFAYDGALLNAAERGPREIVEMLLDKGANANAIDNRRYSRNYPRSYGGKYSAFQAAVKRRNKSTAELLLERGADINSIGIRGSALHRASQQDDQDTVKWLLNRGADIESDGGEFSDGSALVTASFCGNQGTVELLLDRGANVNASGKCGNALQAASYEGDLEVVKLLLHRGADINAHREVVIDAINSQTLLNEDRGETVDLGLLFDDMVWCNTIGKSDPLQLAVYGGSCETVKLLLDRGAGIHVNDRYGSALQVASARHSREVIRLLLDRGANVNAVARHFPYSALQIASYGGYRELVELLLDEGADIHAIGPSGNALQIARVWEHQDVVELLLARGAE